MSEQVKSNVETHSIDAEAVVDSFTQRNEFGHRVGTDSRGDQRLQTSNIRDVTATIHFKDGSTLEADVFSLTRADVVLRLPKGQQPIEEQAVLFQLYGPDQAQTELAEGLLHWNGEALGGPIAAIFAAELIPRSFFAKASTDRRGEIRFPLDVKAVIRGPGYRQEVRITDYSLNGLGLHVPQPLELDRRYEATLMLDGQLLKLPMLSCFNARSEDDDGYVAGVGLRCLEGSLFACSAFKPMGPAGRPSFLSVSPRFPALNHVNGRGQTPESQKQGAVPCELLVSWFTAKADAIDEKLNDRPVISRDAILILSSLLLGMSLQSDGRMQMLTLFYGMFGVVAYYGLKHAAKITEDRKDEESSRIKREIAERRLQSTTDATIA